MFTTLHHVWLNKLALEGECRSAKLLNWIGNHASFCFDLCEKIAQLENVEEKQMTDHMTTFQTWMKATLQEHDAVTKNQIEDIKETCRAQWDVDHAHDIKLLTSTIEALRAEQFQMYKDYQVRADAFKSRIAELSQSEALTTQKLETHREAVTFENRAECQEHVNRLKDEYAHEQKETMVALAQKEKEMHQMKLDYERELHLLSEKQNLLLQSKDVAYQALKTDHEENLRKVLEGVKSDYEEKVGTFLSRYTTATPAVKGSCGQNAYMQLLTENFPTFDIMQTHSASHSCDIRLSAPLNDAEELTIMVEIKNFTKNVPTKDVQKFQRDVKLKRHHGILISQSTGIAHKQDMEVEIQDDMILIYLTNNKLNEEKIKMAIETIKALAQKQRAKKDSHTDESIVLKKNMLAVVSLLNELALRNDRLKIDLRNHIASLENGHIEQIRILLGIDENFPNKKST